ncbi:40S ribosomal uS7 domain-containing protein [Calcarisporiella thermophila]|uniref:40S ribosomal uS7 domain-containing protein n=1 Tax=Calcarisporiella thermophila TaxID=911321 RepID=UPI003742C708
MPGPIDLSTLQWLNSPPHFQTENSTEIQVISAPRTDFWRSSSAHRDTGHFLYQTVAGDFSATLRVKGEYTALYDQAGIMIRKNDQCWIKAGIELEDGEQFVSAVVTNPFSDWSLLPVAAEDLESELQIKLQRQGPVMKIHYSFSGKEWKMFRKVTNFTEEKELCVGLMLCSPQNDKGMSANCLLRSIGNEQRIISLPEHQEKKMAALNLPADVVAEHTGVRLFNKWSFEEVEIKDISLTDYIQIRNPVYLPHTAGRYSVKRFRKAQCPIVERLTNSLMMHGRNNGKKLMATRIVKHSFEIIHLLTDQNPVQVFVDAVINTGPREDSTRIGSAGTVRRQAVDVSPLRRVNQAIALMTIGAREAAFRNVKSIAECLAEEIINAAKGSSNSYAIKKKDELERVAKSYQPLRGRSLGSGVCPGAAHSLSVSMLCFLFFVKTFLPFSFAEV